MNNPIMYTDPSGNAFISVSIGILLIAVFGGVLGATGSFVSAGNYGGNMWTTAVSGFIA